MAARSSLSSGVDIYFLVKVVGKMSAPQQGGEFSRVPPMNAKPQRMAPVGFNPGPGMGMVRRGMNTRNNALALGLGVAVAGICILCYTESKCIAPSNIPAYFLDPDG